MNAYTSGLRTLLSSGICLPTFFLRRGYRWIMKTVEFHLIHSHQLCGTRADKTWPFGLSGACAELHSDKRDINRGPPSCFNLVPFDTALLVFFNYSPRVKSERKKSSWLVKVSSWTVNRSQCAILGGNWCTHYGLLRLNTQFVGLACNTVLCLQVFKIALVSL